MLNRARNDRISNTSERSSSIVLRITEVLHHRTAAEVVLLELALGETEAGELNTDTGTDADEGSQGAFVEGEGSFFTVDLGGGVEGVGVGGGGLQADLDDIERLTWKALVGL